MEENDNKKKQVFFPYTITNCTFGRIPADAASFLNSFDSAIQNIYPLNSKQIQHLPKNINELSHQLTDERSDRRLGYMNNQVNLLCYAYYFQWWNLYKFTSLFASFTAKAFDFLKNDSVLLDIGSGPLTIPIALWLSRPELRSLNLTFYVMDISQTALKLGEELFLSAAAACPASNNSDPWKIVRVKGELGTEIKQKASFITCGNMFNELIQNSEKSLEALAKDYARVLLSYANTDSALLVMEPGIPKDSHFTALLRNYFVKNGFAVISPCPHYEICHMCSSKSKKWCHFTQDAKYAPQKLIALSSKASLPKENVTLSFTFVSNFHKPVEKDFLTLRIFSDIIKLPDNQFGKYACSTLGLILVTGSSTRKLKSGTELVINISQASAKTLLRDKKSGAYILNIN
ncbi:MAG: hypothetical protein J6T84_07170 [Spirochaetaceae bacterium]|nr:hypothetical protein [Spirochaetaceae bacterium]